LREFQRAPRELRESSRAPSSRAPSSERAPKLRESFERVPKSSERAPRELESSELQRAPRKLESSELQRAPKPAVRPTRSELLRSSGGCPEVVFVATQQAPELWRSSESSLLQRYKLRSFSRASGAPEKLRSLLASSNKRNTKKKQKKVSILLDRGRVGLVGAQASAPTPQQQLHSNSSTARASAPQVELWWWSEAGMVALLKLFWSFLGANNGVIIVLGFPGISYPAYVY
jgi:hypothetical protein